MNPAPPLVPEHLLQLLVTIALTMMMGIEREEKSHADRTYALAGVRTFPIIGLLGYAMGLLSPQNAVPVAVGFAGVAALLVVSFVHKLKDADHGATTEMTVLAAYLVGALVARELLWVAAAMAVGIVLLLQAKAPLMEFAVSLPRREIGTFVSFVLLTAVILPVVPNQEFTQFDLNPFKIWLVVVAVSGISYASYLLQRLVRGRRTALLAALLGGAYSSTVTTVVLAKRSKQADDARLYAGAILMASATMYVRMAVLIWIFNNALGYMLGPRFAALAVVAAVAGYLLATRRSPRAPEEPLFASERNPLELPSAVLFAGLFAGIVVVAQLARQYLGVAGLYAVGALSGLVDVDAFTLSSAQVTGTSISLTAGATAIVIAAASNNVIKGIYAMVFGQRRTGRLALVLLVGLAVASMAVLIGV